MAGFRLLNRIIYERSFQTEKGGDVQVNSNDLERYIKLYRKSVLGAALCYVRNTSDAEDIAQDVFIKLYTYKGSFESDEHIKAWLLRCAINHSKDLLRSFWYRCSEPLEAAAEKVHYDTREGGGLPEAMSKLNPKVRIVLSLHYYEGYSAKEIAQIMHTTESAVLHRLSRGRKQLKDILINERNEVKDGLQESL